MKKMKRVTGLLALLMLCMSLVTSCKRISPGEVGFRIDNAGDYRGIDSLPLLTGWNWFTPFFTYIVTMPTTQQHVAWVESPNEGNSGDESITVACSGGAGFKMDVGLNYRVIPNKASKIYLKYKTDDLKSITSTYIRNVVRGTMQDVSGVITVDSILNNLPSYEHAVRDLLTKRLEVDGFEVDNFNIQKQPEPTDANLRASIAAKIQAKQEAERSVTELQKSIAEANKKIADARGDSASKVINAMGEAEAVKKIQQVLSPTYVEYIKWKSASPNLPRVPSTMLGSSTALLNLK